MNIRHRWTLSVIGIIVIIMVILGSHFRTITFYRQFGIDNPIIVTYLEARAYLGAPAQVAFGVAGRAMDTVPYDATPPKEDVSNMTIYSITPSFFPWQPTVRESYRDYVSIDDRLTTNSAFAQLYPSLGIWVFPLSGAIAFSVAVVIGHFWNYRSMLSLISAILLYCFAELWRVYLFNAGVIWFLVLSLLACAIWTGKRKDVRSCKG